MGRNHLAALAAAGLCAFAGSAGAATLYDSGNHTGASGPALGYPGPFLAGELVFGADVTITGIEGNIRSLANLPEGEDFTVNARSLDGAGLPDTLLGSTSTTGLGHGQTAWQGRTDLSWALTAGAYWFTFEVPSTSGFIGDIEQGAPNPLNRYAGWDGSHWALGGFSDIGLRVFGDCGGCSVTFGAPLPSGGGVPEPSAWALAIAGFGLLGGALRRRTALA